MQEKEKCATINEIKNERRGPSLLEGKPMKPKRSRQSFVVFLSILILFTTAFIFYQSALPPAVSGEESNRVKGFFVTLFGGADTFLGSFFSKYVRKIAHFVEFFALGTECTTLFFVRGKRHFPFSVLPFGFAVGALDETLQRFTGRGPSFLDVCLDFFGFFTATLSIYAVFFLMRLVMRNRKIRKEKEYV